MSTNSENSFLSVNLKFILRSNYKRNNFNKELNI